MEADPSIEFDFFLTQKLGWRTVDEMRAGVSGDEWTAWAVYYGREAQRRQLAAEKG